MNYQDLITACQQDWTDYTQHRFVQELANGSLNAAAYLHYLKQPSNSESQGVMGTNIAFSFSMMLIIVNLRSYLFQKPNRHYQLYCLRQIKPSQVL